MAYFKLELLTLNRNGITVLENGASVTPVAISFLRDTISEFYSQNDEFDWQGEWDDKPFSYCYTYNESVSFAKNAQKTLTFSLDRMVTENGELVENPYARSMQVGTQLCLTDKFGRQYFFTIKDVQYTFKPQNLVYQITCQDTFSYQMTRQNDGYEIINDSTSEDFIGAKSVDWWIEKKIVPECHIAYEYLPLDATLYQDNNNRLCKDSNNNIKSIIKSPAEKTEGADGINPYATIPFAGSGNANSILISLADKLGLMIVTAEGFNEDGDTVRYFWLEPEKHIENSGLRYSPDSSIQAFGLSHRGDSLTTILNVGSNTFDDEIITLLPSIPPFFSDLFKDSIWETTKYSGENFFKDIIERYDYPETLINEGVIELLDTTQPLDHTKIYWSDVTNQLYVPFKMNMPSVYSNIEFDEDSTIMVDGTIMPSSGLVKLENAAIDTSKLYQTTIYNEDKAFKTTNIKIWGNLKWANESIVNTSTSEIVLTYNDALIECPIELNFNDILVSYTNDRTVYWILSGIENDGVGPIYTFKRLLLNGDYLPSDWTTDLDGGYLLMESNHAAATLTQAKTAIEEGVFPTELSNDEIGLLYDNTYQLLGVWSNDLLYRAIQRTELNDKNALTWRGKANFNTWLVVDNLSTKPNHVITNVKLTFTRTPSAEDIEFATMADQIPWLENKIIDFTYFRDNKVISQREFDTLMDIIHNDLRIANGALLAYTSSYYSALHNKTRILSDLTNDLDSIGAAFSADVISKYESNGELKDINYFQQAWDTVQSKYKNISTNLLLNYDETLTDYINKYFNAEQRFLSSIYRFDELFNRTIEGFGEDACVYKDIITATIDNTDPSKFYTINLGTPEWISVDANFILYEGDADAANYGQPYTELFTETGDTLNYVKVAHAANYKDLYYGSPRDIAPIALSNTYNLKDSTEEIYRRGWDVVLDANGPIATKISQDSMAILWKATDLGDEFWAIWGLGENEQYTTDARSYAQGLTVIAGNTSTNHFFVYPTVTNYNDSWTIAQVEEVLSDIETTTTFETKVQYRPISKTDIVRNYLSLMMINGEDVSNLYLRKPTDLELITPDLLLEAPWESLNTTKSSYLAGLKLDLYGKIKNFNRKHNVITTETKVIDEEPRVTTQVEVITDILNDKNQGAAEYIISRCLQMCGFEAQMINSPYESEAKLQRLPFATVNNAATYYSRGERGTVEGHWTPKHEFKFFDNGRDEWTSIVAGGTVNSARRKAIGDLIYQTDNYAYDDFLYYLNQYKKMTEYVSSDEEVFELSSTGACDLSNWPFDWAMYDKVSFDTSEPEDAPNTHWFKVRFDKDDSKICYVILKYNNSIVDKSFMAFEPFVHTYSTLYKQITDTKLKTLDQINGISLSEGLLNQTTNDIFLSEFKFGDYYYKPSYLTLIGPNDLVYPEDEEYALIALGSVVTDVPEAVGETATTTHEPLAVVDSKKIVTKDRINNVFYYPVLNDKGQVWGTIKPIEGITTAEEWVTQYLLQHIESLPEADHLNNIKIISDPASKYYTLSYEKSSIDGRGIAHWGEYVYAFYLVRKDDWNAQDIPSSLDYLLHGNFDLDAIRIKNTEAKPGWYNYPLARGYYIADNSLEARQVKSTDDFDMDTQYYDALGQRYYTIEQIKKGDIKARYVGQSSLHITSFDANQDKFNFVAHVYEYDKLENGLSNTPKITRLEFKNWAFNTTISADREKTAYATIYQEPGIPKITLNLHGYMIEPIGSLSQGEFWYRYHSRTDLPILFEKAAIIETELQEKWNVAYNASHYIEYFLPMHWQSADYSTTNNNYLSRRVITTSGNGLELVVKLNYDLIPHVEKLEHGLVFDRKYKPIKQSKPETGETIVTSTLLNNRILSSAEQSIIRLLDQDADPSAESLKADIILPSIDHLLDAQPNIARIRDPFITALNNINRDLSINSFINEPIVGAEKTYYLATSGGMKHNQVVSYLSSDFSCPKEYDGLYIMTIRWLIDHAQNRDIESYIEAKDKHDFQWNKIYTCYPAIALEGKYSNADAVTSQQLYNFAANAFRDLSHPERAYNMTMIQHVNDFQGYRGQELRIGDSIRIADEEYLSYKDEELRNSLQKLLFITDIKYTLRKDSDIAVTINSIKYQDKVMQRLANLLKK